MLAPWRPRNGELVAMTRLHELSKTLTAMSDLPSLLQAVLNATMELQAAEYGYLQLYDPQTCNLQIAVQYGFSRGTISRFRHVNADTNSTCGAALRRRKRVTIADVQRDPSFPELRHIAASAGFRAAQSTPLLARGSGNLVGMISTCFRRPRRLSTRELWLSDWYARQAADVIDSRLAEQRLRAKEEHVRLPLEVTHLGTWEWDPIAGHFQPRSNHLSLVGFPPRIQLPECEAYWQRMAPEDVRCTIQSALLTEAVRESEARLKAAVDLVKLGLYAWNPRTNELRWDDTLRSMWGLPPQAPVDYDVWRAGVHPDDLSRVEEAVRHCADPEGDGVYDIQYRVIGIRDGIERWIATRGRMRYEDGEPRWFHGVALDITSSKRTEAILERRVEERTRALAEANRQLRKQIEQRESAEAAVHQLQRLDAVGQITSGVAHDFNNLLAIIQVNAGLLADKLRDPGNRESVELIQGAAERGRRLTAQLLAFAGKQDLVPHVVDLNAEIEGMRELLIVTLGKNTHLELRLAADLWTALIDPTQIESIVLNLAINGRDAMKPDGTLTLETANTIIREEPKHPEAPLPGDYVKLSVKDTGAGIPDNILPRVFEPFFTTKGLGKGSGLGLAQVLGIASQSGGGVRIATRMGEGTVVTVFLPRAEAIADDDPGQPRDRPADKPPAGRHASS